MITSLRNRIAALDPATRRFVVWTTVITVAALAFRLSLLSNIAARNPDGGDPLYYHLQANFLVEGHGFSDPFLWRETGRYEPVAIHPPLFTMWLAIASAFGFKSFLAHKVMSCIAGALAVAAIGLFARESGGRGRLGARVGLIAAFLAAVYPPLWSIDGQLWPEGFFTFTVAVTAWCALRAWRARTLGWAAATGVWLALAALTRGEAIIMSAVLVAPILLLRDRRFRRNLGHLAVAGAACALVLAPWMIRNSLRFESFVALSTNSDEVLVYANNPYAYGTKDDGRFLGFWFYPWQDQLRAEMGGEPPGDASQRAKFWGEQGRAYAKAHKGRLPVVLAARLGRGWNLYAPFQNAAFDKIDGKSETISIAGVWAWWAALALSVPGVVLLRRRRMTIVPFVGLAATVSISSLYAYGGNRFRTPLDLAALVLAAVAIEAFVRHGRRRFGGGT
ncbi:MAG: glycosyltransferase family 39 protein [Acidimicrobiales bacterium]|nr:glycosyltransferase family 39 protein [Acidimicrobiales bacterium]